jgi:hypothetical protein
MAQYCSDIVCSIAGRVREIDAVSDAAQPYRHLPYRSPTITGLFGSTILHLDNESSSLHRVDQDVTTLEKRIARPRTNKVNCTAAGNVVVFGVNI